MFCLAGSKIEDCTFLSSLNVFSSRALLVPGPEVRRTILQKGVSIAELRLDELDDRPVLDEDGIKQQKRLQDHLQAGWLSFFQSEELELVGIWNR